MSASSNKSQRKSSSHKRKHGVSDASSSSSMQVPISLITLNTYLFPQGLRHSITYADKQKRADLILKHLRKHDCTDSCSQSLAHSKQHEEGSEAVVDDTDGLTARRSKRRILQNNVDSPVSASTAAVAPASPSIATASSSTPSCPSTTLLAADIVCMQEVLGSFYCQKWKKHFEPLGISLNPSQSDVQSSSRGEYHLIFSPPPRMCSGVLLDGGLLTASRFPVLYSSYQSFRDCPNFMRFTDKGFQHSILDISSRVHELVAGSNKKKTPHVLHVINTHLHPYEASWSVAHGQQVRRSQAQQIREYLLSLRDNDDLRKEWSFDPQHSALVMTGDLNTPQSTEECDTIQKILECPNVSLITPAEPTMHNHHPFCNHVPEQTICGDFVIANQQVMLDKGEIVHEGWMLSDHYPVKAELQVVVKE